MTHRAHPGTSSPLLSRRRGGKSTGPILIASVHDGLLRSAHHTRSRLNQYCAPATKRPPALSLAIATLRPMTSTPRVVSLFSGCGGLDLGFLRAGFTLEFACDHDPAAVRTYSHNIPHSAELLDVTAPAFPQRLVEIGSCDVLLGGFPCQGFSKAGPKNIGDQRNQLYKAMIRALEVVQPAIFVGENVDGISQNFNGQFLNQIIKDCTNAGYEVDYQTVDASWFGVPQHRRRVFIVGLRRDLQLSQGHHIEWPAISHRPIHRNGERNIHDIYPYWLEQLAEPRTIDDAICHLGPLGHEIPDHVVGKSWPDSAVAIMKKIGPGQKLCNARHDKTSVRTWDIPEAFGKTSSIERSVLETIVRNRRHKMYGSIPNGNPLSLEVIKNLTFNEIDEDFLDDLVARRFLKRIQDKWDVAGAMFASGIFRRPLPDQPSPTVLTNFENPRYFIHPRENRPFSVREVAALQTFPPDFLFLEAGVKPTDAYRLIGNAVPPLLAERIAESVLALWLSFATEGAAA
ncbi:DNA-cytosine methyltransferase [Rhodococcus aetherivorans]|nr:DNA-cytosine methyltransferase [Rhodococcus aetherivorans]